MATNQLLQILQILSKSTVGKRTATKLVKSPLLQKTVLNEALKNPSNLATRQKEIDRLNNVLENLATKAQSQIRENIQPGLRTLETTNFLSNYITKSRFQRTISIAQGSNNLEKLQKAEATTRKRIQSDYYKNKGKIAHINEYGKYIIRNSKLSSDYLYKNGYINGVELFEEEFLSLKDADQKANLLAFFIDVNGEKLDYAKLRDHFDSINVAHGRTIGGTTKDPLPFGVFGRGLEPK